MPRLIISLLAAAALSACATTTRPPKPTAATDDARCDTPAQAAMDFWVGEWDVSWTDSAGVPARGSNRVDRDNYGGCVVTERFDGRPGLSLQGMSVSVYDVAARTWRQTWVDNQGGYIALTGGPRSDGSFVLQTASLPDQPRFRMTWTEVEADSLTWRWQRQMPGSAEWEDRWVLDYVRR